MKKYITIITALLLMPFAASAQTAALQADDTTFAPLIEKIASSVVAISVHREHSGAKTDITSDNPNLRDYFLNDDEESIAQGSGFIIDGKGNIVTNHHVIKGATDIDVQLYNGKKFKAEIVGYDEATDLAVIKISPNDSLSFVKMGDSDEIKVGDRVISAGNPFGLGISFSSGIVSAKSRDIDMGSYDNFIQTDAAINQGSSGGPLFDINGRVIGVNTALYSSNGDSIGIGFATPVNLVKFVVGRLLETGVVERSWIGVGISANENVIAVSDNQQFTGGVSVASIAPLSPAEQAEIETGDIIMAINGSDVKDIKDFSRRIAEMPIGRNVILRVWHSNQPKDISLSTVSRPQNIGAKPEVKDEQIAEGYISSLGMELGHSGETVLIRDVMAESQAQTQGLRTGDIITQINTYPITSVSDALSYISYAASGNGKVQMSINRDGEEHIVNMEIKQ